MCSRLSLVAVLLAASASAQNAAGLFDDSVLHEIRLAVHPHDWRTLKQHFDRNTYYPADLAWRGLTARDVAIRSRGLGSRNEIKPGLQVEFGRYLPGRTFLGLERLVLDNTLQDASGLRERLSMALFRKMGLPAPREAHARLYVNGEYAGLYAIVEDIDRVFLAGNFNDPEGYLYEYHWLDDYRFGYLGADLSVYLEKFEPVTHRDAPQGERLEELARLIDRTAEADFIARLSPVLDLRLVTSHIAVENFLAEWDGILGTEGLNNFYLYRPSAEGPFRFIPWDKDVTMARLEHPVDYGLTANALVAKTLAHTEYRNYYFAELARAAETAGGPGGWLASEAERAYAQVRQAAAEDPFDRPGLDEYERRFAEVRDFTRYRSEVVRAALDRLRAATPGRIMETEDE